MTDGQKPHQPLEHAAEVAREALKSAQETAGAPDRMQTVGFFDLSGSTSTKLRRGNTAGIGDALTFINAVSEISSHLDGHVVKTLGDGAMVSFADPMSACRAALTLRYIVHEHLNLSMTAGLTLGRPYRLDLGDSFDLLGDVVDRAARIQSLARPGQILIDSTLHTTIRAEIPTEDGWLTDDHPRRAYAKGIGPLDLYEICLRQHWRLKNQLATPFSVNAEGRPTVAEKIALIRNAQSELIEVGIGLTSFAQYFEGQKPGEFRDPIRELVRGGVDLKCFALDPSYEAGVAWLSEQDNPRYEQEAAIARERILREAKYQRDRDFRGRTSYYTYRRVPEFWCLGVDVEDPVDGRMFFGPYMMGVPRSAMPVTQVSRTSNPALYEHFLQSIRAIREASNEP